MEHLTETVGSNWARRIPMLTAALVAFALLHGIVWAFLIPPLDAPDEPSHLLVVAQIRAAGALPVAFILDPNTLGADSTPRPQPMLDYFARYNYTHFRALPYESTQPPLYYLLCYFLTAPLPDDPATLLYGCRIVSSLLGALTVFAAARAAATLAPNKPAFALGVPLSLALLPQFGFQSATVTNDIALDLAGAGFAWAWAAALAEPGRPRWPVILGAFTALGLLSKLTVALTLPATGLVLLVRTLSRRPALPHLIGEATVSGLIAALPFVPWLVRNLRVYGEPTGSARMFSVIHGIYTSRLHLPADTPLIVPPLDQFAWFSFSSFWAVFGWRGVYLPTPFTQRGAPFYQQAVPFYWLAAGLTALGLGGAVAWAWRRRRDRAPLASAQLWTLVAYALTALAGITGYVVYTLTTDASLQGRYTFVALVPFCVIGVGGVLHATRSPATNRILAGLALVGLLVLQVAAWSVIGD